jgi:hypothetical protein
VVTPDLFSIVDKHAADDLRWITEKDAIVLCDEFHAGFVLIYQFEPVWYFRRAFRFKARNGLHVRCEALTAWGYDSGSTKVCDECQRFPMTLRCSLSGKNARAASPLGVKFVRALPSAATAAGQYLAKSVL